MKYSKSYLLSLVESVNELNESHHLAREENEDGSYRRLTAQETMDRINHAMKNGMQHARSQDKAFAGGQYSGQHIGKLIEGLSYEHYPASFVNKAVRWAMRIGNDAVAAGESSNPAGGPDIREAAGRWIRLAKHHMPEDHPNKQHLEHMYNEMQTIQDPKAVAREHELSALEGREFNPANALAAPARHVTIPAEGIRDANGVLDTKHAIADRLHTNYLVGPLHSDGITASRHNMKLKMQALHHGGEGATYRPITGTKNQFVPHEGKKSSFVSSLETPAPKEEPVQAAAPAKPKTPKKTKVPKLTGTVVTGTGAAKTPKKAKSVSKAQISSEAPAPTDQAVSPVSDIASKPSEPATPTKKRVSRVKNTRIIKPKPTGPIASNPAEIGQHNIPAKQQDSSSEPAGGGTWNTIKHKLGDAFHYGTTKLHQLKHFLSGGERKFSIGTHSENGTTTHHIFDAAGNNVHSTTDGEPTPAVAMTAIKTKSASV